MKLYDTASRQLKNISAAEGSKISLYSCGPTVYDKPTIGNWASFIRYDILARGLRSAGYHLDWVMNITDVGHLVSDADEGEDKLEKGAKRESKTAWQIADFYSGYFLKGLDYFNISIDRKNTVRATDHIEDQINMIKVLEKNGQTYTTEDGIYFDSSTFADYGRMARLNIEGLKEGARVEKGAKRHTTDFALWKFSPKNKKRDMEWDSPWGKGFPGWHIECSAIILHTLGETIDIHAGGIEHIPIHHTNEIAQSESVTKNRLAKLWVHNNHLKIDGSKISKSLGNGYTMEDLKQHGFTASDFRMFVMQSNYRNESNFTWDALEEARTRRLQLQAAADLRFQAPIAAIKDGPSTSLAEYRDRIENAFEDNLNTAGALTELSLFLNGLSEGLIYPLEEYETFLRWLDELLGFELMESQDITQDQRLLIKERNKARLEKNWKVADSIRQELSSQKIALNDLKDDTSLWYRTA